MPRTFQGRLTVAFVAVVALTLVLVTALVLNRLDDYFTNQQQADLGAPIRTRSRRTSACIADVGRRGRPGRRRRRHGRSRPSSRPSTDPDVQADIADSSARPTSPSGSASTSRPARRSASCPAADGTFAMPLTNAAEAGPDPGVDLDRPHRRTGRPACSRRTPFEVTLANPYTYRATAIAQRHRPARRDRAVRARPERPRLGGAGPPVHDPAAPADRGGARRSPRATSRGASRPPRCAPGSSELDRAGGPVQRDGRPRRGERRDHPPRPRPEPRLPGRRLARAADPAGRPADVQRAAQGARRRRPGRARRVPRVERPADRAPRLARPEPARALEARFRAGPARPAAGRPARGGRDGGRAEHGGGPQARRRRCTSSCPTRRSGSATTRSGSARSSRNLVGNAVKFTPRGGVGRRSSVAPTPDGRADRGRPTRASASTRPSCRTSSSASTAARGRTRRAAAGAASAWRSSIDRRHARRHGRRSRAASGRARRSPSSCRATRGSSPGTPAADRADGRLRGRWRAARTVRPT